MSFAWTTLGALALLLPGIAFFGGLYSSDRFPREFGRNNPFMDIGLAIFAAATIHFVLFSLALIATVPVPSVSLAEMVAGAVDTLTAQPMDYDGLVSLAVATMAYLVATPILSFVAGRGLSGPILSGVLRNLARHRWIRDLTATESRANE